MNVNNKAIKAAGIGALISAAFASVCCLGPIVIAALGLGGLGLAAGIAKYRPLFLILTALILGAGFYLTYRRREIACEDGTCELRSGSRTMKTILWVITIIAVALATFPSWSHFLFKTTKTHPLDINNKVISLSISGMHCSACAVNIEKSLKNVRGVQSASVDFDKSEALVVAEPGQSLNRELLDAVQRAGEYTAKIKG